MSFKIHLIIVGCIIAAVYLIWELMHAAVPPTQAPDTQGIPRLIAVTHASLGLNCANLAINNATTPRNAYSNNHPGNSKLVEDNVFSAVSLKCNGKTECEIAVDDPELGEDPAPDCSPKILEVEYRCFSYDRPWRVTASSGGSVKLLCAAGATK